MAGIAHRPAALHRARGRCGPRLCGEGAADQGGRRRGARRGAHAEQRRSAGRGRAHLQGQLPIRIHGHDAEPIRPSAGNFFSVATGRGRASTSSPSTPSTTLPTTFMRLATINKVTIASMGEAQRRMVDLSLVLDVSSSIGSRVAGGPRRRAQRSSNSFDQNGDRIALVTYSNGARVHRSDAFEPRLQQDAGHERHPEHAAWRQHGDGRGPVSRMGRGARGAARPAVGPARDRALHGRRVEQRARALSTGSTRARASNCDFPDNGADPDSQTHANPQINGLYDTETGAATGGFGQPFALELQRGKTLARS